MFCTQCGHIISEEMQYCPECGKKQFDLPTDAIPQIYEHGLRDFIIAFVAAFAVILVLNFMGVGLITFLFLPFFFFGGHSKGRLQFIISGACLGFLCGAVTSIVLRMMGML